MILLFLMEEYCVSNSSSFITNTNPDIIRRPGFHLQHKVSETKFYPHFQVALVQLGAIDITSPCLWTGRKRPAPCTGPY
jgi:hypothetical protein